MFGHAQQPQFAPMAAASTSVDTDVLQDLLDLHDCGEPVSWPAGLTPEGARKVVLMAKFRKDQEQKPQQAQDQRQDKQQQQQQQQQQQAQQKVAQALDRGGSEF